MKRKKESNPRRVYWHFTQFDLSWKPPVPYPEGTPQENIKIRYLAYQLEVCPETGKDHYQGYVQFYEQQYRTQVQKLLGIDKSNVSLEKKTPEASICYVTKLETRKNPTDQPFVFGVPSLVSGKGGRSSYDPESIQVGLSNALKQETKEEFLEVVKKTTPRDFIICNKQISIFAEKQYPTQKKLFEHQYPLDSFIVPEQVKLWMNTEFKKKERAKCLLLVGASQLGKTKMIRHILPQRQMYWRTDTNLSEWDQEAEVIILDDIDWKGWRTDRVKGWITQNGPCTLTDKYMKKVTVNVDKPCVILCNTLPRWFFHETEYWYMNILQVDIKELCYKKVAISTEEEQEREEGQRLLDERAQQCIEYGEEEPQEITDLVLFKKRKINKE